MRKIRSVLISVMFFIFGAGSVIINFILFPILKKIYDKKRYREVCSDVIHYVWKFFIFIMKSVWLFRVDIKNLGEIRNKIIVATHPSFIDVLILMSIIPRTTCFVKKSLQLNPILTNIVDSIFLTNDMEIDELKEKTKEMLDAGFSIIMFPMGTRHMYYEFPKVRKGASLVALNSGVNIVPVRMCTDDKFLFIDEPFYAVGSKRVTFTIEQEDEINISDYYNESEIITKRELTKAIENRLYKNRIDK